MPASLFLCSSVWCKGDKICAGIQTYTPDRKRLKLRRFFVHENRCPRCFGWKEAEERLCADCELDELLELTDLEENSEPQARQSDRSGKKPRLRT